MTQWHYASLATAIVASTALAVTGHDNIANTVFVGISTGIFTLLVQDKRSHSNNGHDSNVSIPVVGRTRNRKSLSKVESRTGATRAALTESGGRLRRPRDTE